MSHSLILVGNPVWQDLIPHLETEKSKQCKNKVIKICHHEQDHGSSHDKK